MASLQAASGVLQDRLHLGRASYRSHCDLNSSNLPGDVISRVKFPLCARQVGLDPARELIKFVQLGFEDLFDNVQVHLQIAVHQYIAKPGDQPRPRRATSILASCGTKSQ